MPEQATAAEHQTPLLHIEKLSVRLPSGRALLEEIDLKLGAGEVVALLGGSGAGKSTLSRVLFEPEALAAQGFKVEFKRLDFERDNLGLVPQRGALFDHLNVGGNIELAANYRRNADGPCDVDDWLERVGLPAEMKAQATGGLSGGQAQRVAVARAMASERRLLLLDEPSVGLDPHRVRMLARLIREQADALGLAIIVVTHDPALAAGVADTLFLLDPQKRKLVHLFADEWPGPVEREGVSEADRGRWLLALEDAVVSAVASAPIAKHGGDRGGLALWRGVRERVDSFFAPFAVAAASALALFPQLLARPRDFLRIAKQVVTQALLRPALFYAIVSTLIGFTLLFVISKVGGAGVRADALIRQIGGSYAVALAPPLAAILFIAASGSATNAWLGSIELTRQSAALEALGVRATRYLWAPAWLSLGLCFLCVAALVSVGMLFGGYLLCVQLGMDGAWELLSADLIDPRPERADYVSRALFLLWMYGWGIASNTVAKGSAPKLSADQVTKAMTAGVVSATLWVVSLELASVLWLFGR